MEYAQGITPEPNPEQGRRASGGTELLGVNILGEWV
jgi:hypothetical protein